MGIIFFFKLIVSRAHQRIERGRGRADLLSIAKDLWNGLHKLFDGSEQTWSNRIKRTQRTLPAQYWSSLHISIMKKTIVGSMDQWISGSMQIDFIPHSSCRRRYESWCWYGWLLTGCTTRWTRLTPLRWCWWQWAGCRANSPRSYHHGGFFQCIIPASPTEPNDSLACGQILWIMQV